MTKNEFIKKAKSIHGNKYNYEYIPDNINLKEKIILECIHGKFEKLSSCHLYKKSGCSKCHHDKINPKSNDFFKNCKIKHSSLYIYDEKSFISMKKPIVFYCKIHGINNQMAYNHLNGQGCNKCAKNKRNLTTEDFIKKSIEIHKDKYNYSNSIYINTKTKIEIICPYHGSYFTIANNHLHKNKYGCPMCDKSKGEIEVENILNKHKISYKPQFTFPDLKYKKRLRFDFGISKNNELKCLIEFNGKQHYKFNAFFHKTAEKFEASKIRDQLKIDYCFKNNIPLHIIRYDDEVKYKLGEIFNIYFDVIFE